MATVVKVGRRWRCQVRLAGHAKLSETFDTKGKAVAWGVDTERRLRSGQSIAPGKRIVRDVWDRYSEKVSPGKRGMRWEQIRLAALSKDEIALKPLHTVGPADFAEFRDRRLEVVTPSTVRREWVLLSHTFRIAIDEWRWLDAHPMKGVRRPEEGESRRRRVSAQEVKALRVASGYRPDAPPDTVIARVQAAFELALETMMRGNEILRITPATLHLDRSYVHLPHTKNGKARDVALSHRAVEIIRQVMALKFDPIFGLNSAQKDAHFRKATTKAGIEDLHFHDARHEAATQLARKLDVLDLALMGGWQDVNLLRRVYYNATGEEIASRLNA